MFGSAVTTKKFFISYDLVDTEIYPDHRSGAYQRIEKMLEYLKAKRVLDNLWFYEGVEYPSAESIKGGLRHLFGDNDRLLVIDANSYAYHNLKQSII